MAEFPNLTVGIVGFGFIGKVHAHGHLNLPLYYDLPVRTRITHVCTSRESTAVAGRDQIGADVACTDYREITENPDIDLVHICTPNDQHHEALLSAMAQQKHIYCDKPLTATLAQAEAVAAALPAYRGTGQMTLQNRFFPATMRARQLIDEGFLGQVLEYRCCYLHSGSADPQAPLKWKLSAAAGGGVIADLGSHALDLVHYLLGDFQSLTAATKIAYRQRPSLVDRDQCVSVDAEDCVMLLARMANGALGHIEATKIATGTEDEMRIEIHGSQGGIRFNGMDPHHLEIYDSSAAGAPMGGRRGWTRVATGQRYPAPANGFPTPKASIGWMRGHMDCLARFVAAAAEDRPGDPGLAQGVYIQRLMAACQNSATNGTWVELT